MCIFEICQTFWPSKPPKSFSLGPLSIHSSASRILGIALTQVRDLALGPVKLHEVHIDPPLKPVQVPLNGIPSLLPCGVDHASELGVVSELVECVSTAHAADKDIKQLQPQRHPLRSTAHHYSPYGLLSHWLQLSNCNHLGRSLSTGWSIHKPMLLRFRDKGVVQDSIKCLAQGQLLFSYVFLLFL